MDKLWKSIIWRQFGAAIDTLGNAIGDCPEQLWRERLWDHPSYPSGYSEYWYLAFHTLFWLDFYLSGSREGFTPPFPFTLGELDPAGSLPDRPYTKEELIAYLDHGRVKCQATIEGLSDEEPKPKYQFRWGEFSFEELLLYNMRHVQEHAAQLNLFLGQKIGLSTLWVGKVKSDDSK